MTALLTLIVVVIASLASLSFLRQRELTAHANSLEELNGELAEAARTAQNLTLVAQVRALEARESQYASQITQAAIAGRDGDLRAQRGLLEHWVPRSGQFDHRGFEWSYLQTQVYRDCETLFSTGSAVYLLVRSPDGHLLAAGGKSGVVWLLDETTGSVVRALETSQIEVNGMAFSSDGRQLATAGDDGTPCIWRISDASKMLCTRVHPHKAFQVIWDHANDRLFSCGDDSNRGVERLVAEWNADGELTLVQPAQDGSRVAVARWQLAGPGDDEPDHAIWLLSLPQLENPTRLDLAWSNQVAFGPNSNTLALRTSTGLTVWGNHFQPIWEAPQPDVQLLRFDKLGKLLFSRIGGRHLIARDAATGDPRFTLSAHRAPLSSLALSPNGRTLATCDETGVRRLAHVPSGSDLYELAPGPFPAFILGFSSTGRELICVDRLSATGDESEVTVLGVGHDQAVTRDSSP